MSERRKAAEIKAWAGVPLAAAAIFVAAALGQEAPSVSKSLVLKNLLDRVPAGAGEASRDIFRPRRALPTPEAAGVPGVPGPGGPPGGGDPAVAPNLDPAIVYIGYVRSERTTVGLILTGGRTLAVTAGEEIAPGYRVAKITRTQIEVLGPESRVIVYAIEGDES